MIRVPGRELEVMRREASRRYPEECCGILLGRPAPAGPTGHPPRTGDRPPDVRTVVEARPVTNVRREERDRRYLIGPETVLKAEREAERRDLEVVGFFHSHPDHPATPSAFDQEHAWPWYSYLILPVSDGTPGRARAWRLADDRSRFEEEELRVE